MLAGITCSHSAVLLFLCCAAAHVFVLHRLEAAVIDTYIANDKSVLTPDVGGTGNTTTFTDAVCSRL
jgi:isocitrate/isopropylmalate dehydrogenase